MSNLDSGSEIGGLLNAWIYYGVLLVLLLTFVS